MPAGDGARSASGEPVIKEARQPLPYCGIVNQVAVKMGLARLGSGHSETVRAQHRPAMHGVTGDLWVELETIGRPAVTKALVLEGIAGGDQIGTAGQTEALPVPVIDMFRPGAEIKPGSSRPDRIIADLDAAFRMRPDLSAKLFGQHLGTETDAEEWLVLAEWRGDPVDFPADPVVGVVGTHRSAKYDCAVVLRHGRRQRFSKTGPADIQPIAPALQHVADTPRSRGLGM